MSKLHTKDSEKYSYVQAVWQNKFLCETARITAVEVKVNGETGLDP